MQGGGRGGPGRGGSGNRFVAAAAVVVAASSCRNGKSAAVQAARTWAENAGSLPLGGPGEAGAVSVGASHGVLLAGQRSATQRSAA